MFMQERPPGYVTASRGVVYALTNAAYGVWRGGGQLIDIDRVVVELCRRLRRPMPAGVPDTATALVLDAEVEATLREAAWHARKRLRKPFEVPGPEWSDRVRAALGRTFDRARATRTTRRPGLSLLLHTILADHGTTDVDFVNGEPNADALIRLRLSDVLVGPERLSMWLLGRVLDWVKGRQRWYGPIEHTVRREAVRQAVRTGCDIVGQAHLCMGICALDFQLEQTGRRLASTVVPTSRGGCVLAEHRVDYRTVANFEQQLSPAGPAPAVHDSSWKRAVSDPPYGADLYAACGHAMQVAQDRGDRWPGTSHLLYAIVCDVDGPGSQMLCGLGADVSAIRAQLGHELKLHRAAS